MKGRYRNESQGKASSEKMCNTALEVRLMHVIGNEESQRVKTKDPVQRQENAKIVFLG